MADDEGTDDQEPVDTAALLDQGEQLLAESARLLRRLDAALERKGPDLTPLDRDREPDER